MWCPRPLDPRVRTVETVAALYLHSVQLLPGHAVSVFVCVFMCVCVLGLGRLGLCVCYSRTRLQHCVGFQAPTPICSHILAHFTPCLAGKPFCIFLHFIPTSNWGQDTTNKQLSLCGYRLDQWEYRFDTFSIKVLFCVSSPLLHSPLRYYYWASIFWMLCASLATRVV